MKQSANKKIVRKIFKEVFPANKFKFINIHGGMYMETGLPDYLILSEGNVNPYTLDYMRLPHFWFEIKRDWNDEPSQLQKHQVKDLATYNYVVTGFVAGDEYKAFWEEKPTKLKTFLQFKFLDSP